MKAIDRLAEPAPLTEQEKALTISLLQAAKLLSSVRAKSFEDLVNEIPESASWTIKMGAKTLMINIETAKKDSELLSNLIKKLSEARTATEIMV